MLVSIFVISDRNRTAPVTLARNQPVTHFESGFFATDSTLFKPSDNLLANIRRIFAIKHTRIHQFAFAVIANIVVSHHFWFFDNFHDIKIEFFRKFIIALVVRRHRHHRTFAIAAKHIIAHPDRNFFARRWIYRIISSENAGFFFVFLAFDFGFFERILLIAFDFSSNISAGEFRNKRVFWCQSQECHAKNRIWSRGENFDFFALSFTIGDFEFDFSAFGFSDPISLHCFDFFGPIKLVDIFQKFVRISRNLEKPLCHFFF